MSTVGERITAARGKVGWTQGELARQMGVTLSAVSHWTIGLRKPGDHILKLISDKTGVRFEWLKSGKGEMVGEDADTTSQVDKFIIARLSDLEKAVLLKFLRLTPGDKRNIRVYLDQRIDTILERYRLREEEDEEEEG